MNVEPLVLGIDGGGTKTVAWLAPLVDPMNTIVLGRGQAGPGNPRAAGFDIAQKNIAAAIHAAFADAKIPPAQPAAACFGLAGAGRVAEQRQIEEWAQNQGLAGEIRVCGDVELVLAAASSNLRGIALICGTGSVAWGRNAAGQVARCGGWGYLLGDEGSGYAIAQAGLNAALRMADGRGQSSILLDRLLQALDAAVPQVIVERIYAAEMTRERVAELCKVVFKAAEEDPVARTIVDSAAEQLAEMVATLCRRLEVRAAVYPLALAGSVILNQPLLRDRLNNALGASGHAPGSTWLVPDPVRGAIALARAFVA